MRSSARLLFVIGLAMLIPAFSFYVSDHRIKQKRLHVLPHEYYYDGGGGSKRGSQSGSPASFLRALCIAPPTKDWDRLQRARHYARDPAFHEWPPVVRLFHPFHGTAFDVAQAIEELDIEPFDICFDTWVIVPNMEALQTEWENVNAGPDVIDAADPINPYEEEDRIVKELIASEEQKGREKYEARRKGNGAVREIEQYPAEEKKSPAGMLEEQKRQYEESGGPCVLCLEPDEESKAKLIDLRQAIADMMDHDTYSSPSSLYSWNVVNDMDMGFRPLIPISSYDNLQGALDVARRLKGLWGDSLNISVNEFHLISCQDDSGEEELGSFVPQSITNWSKEPWMCNAKVMLVGEEMEQDESVSDEMMRQLMEDGQPGGMDISNDFTILDNEEESISDIEDWLNLDEDWDEGTQVVIGRTHFFTGEQRTYPGMPASSSMDAKDRSTGEGGGTISGLARRRRTASRQRALCKCGGDSQYSCFRAANPAFSHTHTRARRRVRAERYRLFANSQKQEEKEGWRIVGLMS